MPFSQYNKSSTKWGSSSKKEDPFDIGKVQRQIDNARLRINDSGFNPDEDKRNWFEKATNLPEGQNWFFDTLELLDRPGQGIRNVIANKGEDAFENAWQGFSGKEKVRGTDLAEKAGIENKVGKFTAGLGIDILTDPLNLIPGKAIATGIGAGAKGVKAGYNAVENVVTPLKTARETVQPIADATKDALGNMFKYQYKWDETLQGGKDDTLKNLFNRTDENIRFQSEEAMKDVAGVAKSTGLEAGEQVGRLMEKDLKQFEEIPLTKKQLQNVDDLTNEINVVTGHLKNTNKELLNIKNFHKEQVLNTSKSPLLSRIKEMTGGKMLKTSGMEEIKTLPNWLKRKDGVPVDEVANELGYKYADDFIRDLRGALDNTPKSSDVRLLIKERLEADPLYKKLSATKQSLIDTLGELKQAKKEVNPESVEIPRPEREMPADPNIQQAAHTLIRSNNEIRQWARDNGIAIKELEGYMTHVLSAEERKARKLKRAIPVDRGNFGTGQPNKKILNQRKYAGSVEDINEQVGRKLFEPNAYFSTAIGQKRLIEYVNAVKFRKDVLSNPNFAQKYEKGMVLPPNSEIIDTNNYTFLKEADDILEGVVETEKIGGKYVVTKGAKEALDRYKKLNTDEGTKAFLKAFDTGQTWWKRLALFSIPYHLRNDVGAKFNNWVGGMNAVDLAKYSAQADVEVYNAIIKGKESKLYNEYRRQGLGASSLSKVEFARYGEEPERAIEKTIQKASQFDGTLTGRLKAEGKQLKNPLNVFETSREFGDFIDQTNRFAIYKWARDKGMSPEEAAKKVRETQFDYTRLANFEREFATRLIPFYRWMRNNIPYQIKQFINDPRKYANINKARLNAQEAVGIEDEDVPDWMKENFAFPVTGDGQGSGKFLSINLPVGDLIRAGEPLKTLTDSATPLGKLPVELSLNRNFFYNKPIEKFEGHEKQFRIPGTNVEFGIPAKTAYALEQGTGQVGRGFSQYLQKPESVDQDTKFRMPSLGISSVVKDYDVKQAKFFQLLNELRKLQDEINYIEQQTGTRPRTVNEIR